MSPLTTKRLPPVLCSLNSPVHDALNVTEFLNTEIRVGKQGVKAIGADRLKKLPTTMHLLTDRTLVVGNMIKEGSRYPRQKVNNSAIMLPQKVHVPCSRNADVNQSTM